MNKHYLLISKLQIQSANALSSPLTYGFPAVTAFAGFGHALQRHFNGGDAEGPLEVSGVGIVSHRCDMLAKKVGYDRYLQLTANPLNEKGERPSFVEEGRCHLTVSLVLETNELSHREKDCARIADIIVSRMKLAGGDILKRPTVEVLEDDRRGLRKLMPGYVLIDRRQLMQQTMQEGCDALEAMHRHLRLEFQSKTDDDGKTTWTSSRNSPGWIVPIAVGFQGISPLGQAEQTRDSETPHRFAEAVLTLGEFIMAYRVESLAEMMWRYRVHGDLYLCQQQGVDHATQLTS